MHTVLFVHRCSSGMRFSGSFHVLAVSEETFQNASVEEFCHLSQHFPPFQSKTLTKSIKTVFVPNLYRQDHIVFSRYFTLVKVYMGGEKDHQ